MDKSLRLQFADATEKLVEMVRECCWNDIVPVYRYILSDPADFEAENFDESRKIRRALNDRKTPVSLDEALETLITETDKPLEINLFIYRVSSDMTVIEIQFHTIGLSNSEHNQLNDIPSPRIYCKVSIPAWVKNRDESFDANWESNAE